MISPASSLGGRIAPVVAIVSIAHTNAFHRLSSLGERVGDRARPTISTTSPAPRMRQPAVHVARVRLHLWRRLRCRACRSGARRSSSTPPLARRLIGGSVPRPGRRAAGVPRRGLGPDRVAASAGAGRSASRGGRSPSRACGASSPCCPACDLPLPIPRPVLVGAPARGLPVAVVRRPVHRRAASRSGSPRRSGRAGTPARRVPARAARASRRRPAGGSRSGRADMAKRVPDGPRAAAPRSAGRRRTWLDAALELPPPRGDRADPRRPAPAPPAGGRRRPRRPA